MKHCIINDVECKYYKYHYKNSKPCLECNDNVMNLYKPKQPEETMTEKKPFDEKEIRHLYYHGNGESNLGVDTFIYNLKKYGYIIKPEIEKLIEECEKIYKEFNEWGTFDVSVIVKKSSELIQLLKPYYYKSKEGSK